MQAVEKQLKFYKISAFLLLAVVLVGSGILISSKKLSGKNSNTAQNLSQKAKPLFETNIGKAYDFPVKKNGRDKFRIKLEKATLVKLVTTKGKPVLAKEGNSYLLIYLQIDNNLINSLNVGSQNYFRLVDNEKRFAPDFYNTQVLIAPISTKSDQIGFVVKADQKNFQLQVGEIDGKKDFVQIKF